MEENADLEAETVNEENEAQAEDAVQTITDEIITTNDDHENFASKDKEVRF